MPILKNIRSLHINIVGALREAPLKRKSISLLFITLLIAVTFFTAAPAASQDNAIKLSEPVVGDLAGGEADNWIFSGEAGQIVTLSAERFPPDPDTELDPMLELYDPNGNLIISDNDSAPGTDAMVLRFALPSSGNYGVTVRNVTTWAGGTYRLVLESDHYPPGCQTPLGTMIPGEMPSTINGSPVRYRVFLPPCAEVMQRRYPYMLLMHGSNTDDRHWEQLEIDEAIVRGMALNHFPPMALVLPFGGELANINTFRAGVSWEFVITDEMLPFMEANYCLATTRDQRAIGGISRGGFWAFEIAFRHPELFAILGGHSPYFDLYHAPATNNPLDLVLAPPPNPPLRIGIDRGKNDYAQLNIDLIHDRLTQNGIEHSYMLYAVGQHENDYWSAHVDDYLEFYSLEWADDFTTLPACDLVTAGSE